jgi:hypothetical protein
VSSRDRDTLDRLKAYFQKTLIDTAVGFLLDKYSSTMSPVAAMRATMIEIARIKFGTDTRPYKYMMHFLGGSGKEVHINLAELFKDDKGIKDRVISEVFRRVSKVNTVSEKQRMAVSTSQFPNGIDPVITLSQSNFTDENWRLSLGTYSLEIKQLYEPKADGGAIAVTLVGDNLYRWHAGQARITQTIHQIGVALVNLGEAKDFRMVSNTMSFLVDKQYAKLLELTTLRQFNPQVDKPVVTPGAIGRGLQSVLGFGG